MKIYFSFWFIKYKINNKCLNILRHILHYAPFFFFQLGSYFLTNLCLVVVATQFSETRQRESALMEEARRKSRSTSSTIFTATDTESSKGCYNQLLSMMKHYIQRGCRKLKTKLFGENKKHLAQQRRRKKKRHPTTLLQGGSNGGRGTKYQYGNGGGDVHYHHHHHHHIHHHHLHLCNNNTEPSTNNHNHQPRIKAGEGCQQNQSNGHLNMRDEERRSVWGIFTLLDLKYYCYFNTG